MISVGNSETKGIRLTTTLLNGYVVEWQGDADTVNMYAQKLRAAGYRVEVRDGFKYKELRLDVESVLQKAIGPIGALPTQPSQTFTAG